jgi:hypothetical protein
VLNQNYTTNKTESRNKIIIQMTSINPNFIFICQPIVTAAIPKELC